MKNAQMEPTVMSLNLQFVFTSARSAHSGSMYHEEAARPKLTDKTPIIKSCVS